MRKTAANMTPVHSLLVVTSVLIPIVLSVAKLSGDNLCHKRETYTVTMRILVKEPVQVKSYTWCLRVPPRCTKYKIEMRDKYKIQTELRERVLDICCKGYAPDKTETYCRPLCTGCLHGVCETPDNCTCQPGYTGQHCDTECGEGLWGPECEQECLCKNGAECHHVTGDCTCSHGWTGNTCDIPCPKGTYGNGCINECNCSTDGKNSTCHHVTGDCLPPQTTQTIIHHTTTKHQEMDQHVTETPLEEKSTTVIRTTVPVTNSDATTVLPTQSSVQTTQNFQLPNTEKHIFYIEKFTMVPPNTTSSLQITEITSTTIMTTLGITEASDVTVFTREEKETTIWNDVPSNSITKQTLPTEEDKPKEDSSSDDNDKLNSLGEEKEEEASTPQNIQIPPRGIIVVSDGLMSDVRNEEESVNESKDSREGIWDLVSSVSVAGGVALALILMAAVTLLVSHHRNKKKVSISGKKANSASQQSATPGPQMYNYTEEVTTVPLRHLFPDVTYQTNRIGQLPDGLQLRFGDIASTTSGIGQPYNDVRAYLELQYDIPPSSLSSKTSSFQPGLESEHLYDEIPCWRSNTTASTSTETDTSRC